jgi:hypothetical protein
MNNDTSSPPPAAREAASTGLLPVRRLNNPHFVLKAPDNVSDYYDRFNIRVVKSEAEPLARLLADGEDKREGRNRQIEFRVGAGPLPNLRPLQYLTLSEVEAFEKAARAFYERAHEGSQVTFTERELRKNFKLPDPDKEPDAYWLYGDRFAPKLVILWGCEAERGSSLPLIEDAELGIKGVPTVAQKLRARLLSWEHMQREALELIATTNDPLGRFLAFPVINSKGELLAIEQRGIKIPLDKFRRLKSLPLTEVNEFEQAALEFYRQAHPAKCNCDLCARLVADENAVLLDQKPAPAAPAVVREAGPYEKEVRRAFRLPDLERLPKSYWIYGSSLTGRLLILCPRTDEKQQEEQYKRFEYKKDDCLCLVADPVLSLPAPAPQPAKGEAAEDIFKAATAEAAAGKPQTITAQLRQRQVSWASVVVKAAAVLGVLLVLAVGVKLLWPRSLVVQPPVVVDDSEALDPKNDRNVLVATFNNSISRKSLQAPLAVAFTLEQQGATNVKIKIASAVRDARVPNKVILLAGGPLNALNRYTLTMQGVRDIWGNTLAVTTAPVSYADKRPPLLRAVKAMREGNNKLLVEFNEALNKLAAEVATNYAVTGGTITRATLRDDRVSVVLETSAPFAPNTTYSGSVQRVADLAGNPMPLTPFTLTPKVEPPRIKQVLANLDQRTLRVQFDGALDAAYAASVANYVLDPGLKATNAAVVAPDTVELHLTKPVMVQGKDYKLTATVKDAAGWGGEDSRAFQYSGAVDTTPPTITDVLLPSARQLRLTFDEDLWGPAVELASSYRISVRNDGGWSPLDLQLTPSRDPASRNLVNLNLASAHPELSQMFRVEARGLEDGVGNLSNATKEYWNKGPTYVPRMVNNRLAPDAAHVLLTFSAAAGSGELDARCIVADNFKLWLNGAPVTLGPPAQANIGGATIVTLALPGPAQAGGISITGTWSNLRLSGEVRVTNGVIQVK